MTEKTQSEALRLAAWLKDGVWFRMSMADILAAGNELSRQHYALEAKDARIAELEEQVHRLQLLTQGNGSEAYDIACEEMECWQQKRAAAGKDEGTTQSLVDGMAWLYEHIEELEGKLAGGVIVPVEVANLYDFMRTAFLPTNAQQEEIAISLELARKACGNLPIAAGAAAFNAERAAAIAQEASKAAIPEDIHAALLKVAKTWLLTRYVGDRFKLAAWSDHYAHLVSIRSYSLPGDRAKNLRRLDRLVRDGVLVEQPRYRQGIGVRSFTVERHALDEIGQQAIREWEAVGYVVGEMMPEQSASQNNGESSK